jgi:hypothetical protein
MAKKKPKKIQVHMFFYNGIGFAIPRGEAARVEILTRRKRKHPDGFSEAVKKLEDELTALIGDQQLTDESWIGSKSPMGQARVKAAMAVLLSFGISQYPIPKEQEEAARALAEIDA